MTPIQQLMLGVGGAKKTYLDEVFSTYVYKGTGSSKSIDNGIDLSGEGGMVWFKKRSSGWHQILDTNRGVGDTIYTNSDYSEVHESQSITSYNNNGWTMGGHGGVNQDTYTFSSWTFRKAPGFFDVVTYTGNGSGQTIAHSLGCVPGCIMVKCTSDGSTDWRVYHRSIGNGKALELNGTDAEATNTAFWNDTDPTSTHFTVGTSLFINGSSKSYVAYVFACGESTAATARSVDFQSDTGVAATLTIPDHSDLNLSTSNFTIEGWFYVRAENKTFFSTGGGQTASNQAAVYMYDDEWSTKLTMRDNAGNLVQNGITIGATPRNQWFHLAITRDGATFRVFMNGIQKHKVTSSATLNDPSNYSFNIGSWNNGSQGHLQGKISNFRVVKGTAVYTSSFRPPTEPLTNITNTKLLCCNNSTNTGSTVTPTTITAVGDAVADTDSPFDDPAGFVFGDAGNQNVIKCGSYVGNGSATGPEINLGWEPQWILVKQSSDSGNNWRMWDTMRGIRTGGYDPSLYPSAASGESGSTDRLDLTSTSFKITRNDGAYNGNGETYIYIAIRRPDGYVGKPAEAGTDVFAMDVGNSSSTIPCFDSGFPVDLALLRQPNSESSWYATGRLIETKYLFTDTTAAEADGSSFTFDSNAGWQKNANDTGWMSWMWKRHAGFDVVTYTGDGVAGRQIPHSLSKTPKMIWIKKRNNTGEWIVGHHGVNGGTNPWEYEMLLHSNVSQGDSANKFNDTAPTAIAFTVGSSTWVNGDGDTYIAMLFDSVPGISAVGFYDGQASGNINLTSQLDFTPRFFMCKSTSASTGWLVVDKTRDTNMGKRLFFDTNAAETSYDAVFAMTKYLEPNKTGLSVDGEKYIFYAHA